MELQPSPAIMAYHSVAMAIVSLAYITFNCATGCQEIVWTLSGCALPYPEMIHTQKVATGPRPSLGQNPSSKKTKKKQQQTNKQKHGNSLF